MDFAMKGWIWVISGVLLIGIGGVFSTWGWDNINKKSRRDALLFALTREWSVNQAYLLTKPLAMRRESPDLGERHNPYPRFQTVVLQGILASDLIRDRELTLLSINYIQYANICNHYFAAFDNELGMTKTRTQRLERYKEIDTTFAPLQRFRSLHTELKGVLTDKYRTVFDRALQFAKEAARVEDANAQGRDAPMKGGGAE